MKESVLKKDLAKNSRNYNNFQLIDRHSSDNSLNSSLESIPDLTFINNNY